MFEVKWENKAIKELAEIFEFWNEHNHSNKFSKKLYVEVKHIEKLLENNSDLGEQTDFKNIRRILILSNFSMFYFVSKDNIIYILSVWDNRRNPESLDL